MSRMLHDWILSQMAEERRARLRELSDEALKGLWDRAETDEDTWEFAIEDIHAALNERGLGEYCAV